MDSMKFKNHHGRPYETVIKDFIYSSVVASLIQTSQREWVMGQTQFLE